MDCIPEFDVIYLEDASIIAALESGSEKMKRIEGPEKIFLANTNQLFGFLY